ncbi:hypothetical protein KARMA_0619 [Donghicola eburneus]|uniref:Uncharacterized protein n=1 Tax=Donghicola eburneus TaxID=393278 RepID=A0A1M4MXK2_9RHOB|nr:hypothetical protein KARMA_0619 [Donghicola eburneus]
MPRAAGTTKRYRGKLSHGRSNWIEDYHETQPQSVLK